MLVWTDLRQRMSKSNRSLAWRQAGRWALDSVERHLGEEWLEKHARRNVPLPKELTHADGDIHALSHLLEFGLRLELLQGVTGFPSVRRSLRTSIGAESRLHALVQLEVAALAIRAGLPVQLERSTTTPGRPADVLFGVPGSQVSAEVRIVLQDQLTTEGARYDYEFGTAITALEMAHGVVIGGQMTVRLDDVQQARLLMQLAAAAESAAQRGTIQEVAWDGEIITVQPTATADDVSFTGPVTQARGWARTRGILIDKVAQLAAQGGGWLRVDCLDGLFQASAWARKPLHEMTSDMEVYLREAVAPYPSVHGVVLTSGSCAVAQLIGCSSWTDRGSYGLARPLPMGQGRATFVTPLRTEAHVGLRQWRDLYDGEAAWLDWALRQAELPAISDIMA